MLIARALQALGCLAMIGAGLLAFNAQEPVPARPSQSAYCQALQYTEDLVAQRERRAPRPPEGECLLPPGTRWLPAQLSYAAEAALAALLLIGLGAGLGDLRRIRERVEKRGHD